MCRAVEIQTASLGPGHPNTQEGMRNYRGIAAPLKGAAGEGAGEGIAGPQRTARAPRAARADVRPVATERDAARGATRRQSMGCKSLKMGCNSGQLEG
jgi:hypothetical protein